MITKMTIQIKRNERGQALSELAIFAALFLFVLSLLVRQGLGLFYQTQEQQVAFRNALYLANLGANNYLQGNYVSLTDKPFPSADDDVGTPGHYPVAAGASVPVWSENAMGEALWNDARTLPKVRYVINGNRIDGSGVRDVNGNLVTASATDGFLYIANFQRRPMALGDTIRVKKDNGLSWEWEEITLSWQAHLREYDFNGDGINEHQEWSEATKPLEKGMQADVDGDDKEEKILGWLDDEQPIDADDKTIFVSELRYLDSQEGEIDLSIDDNDLALGRKVQGIQAGYDKNMVVNSLLTKEENTEAIPDAISNVTTADSIETITHTFALRNQGEAVSGCLPDADDPAILNCPKTATFERNETTQWITPNN